MKRLILSRKGFDAKAGGVASPILRDGRIYSLPIPQDYPSPEKYRDLSFLVSFGTQLLMYATPIIYPLSAVPDHYKNIIAFNPMTSIIEGFRFSFFNQGHLNLFLTSYSVISTLIIFILGLLLFNKIERTFIDTI